MCWGLPRNISAEICQGRPLWHLSVEIFRGRPQHIKPYIIWLHTFIGLPVRATRGNTLQRTTTHYNTLHHTTTHYITLMYWGLPWHISVEIRQGRPRYIKSGQNTVLQNTFLQKCVKADLNTSKYTHIERDMQNKPTVRLISRDTRGQKRPISNFKRHIYLCIHVYIHVYVYICMYL